MNGPLNDRLREWFDLEHRDPICVDSLAPERAAREAVGAPDDGYPVVTVAGTNGKGSTTRFVARSLLAAGHSVGMMSNTIVTEPLCDVIRVDEEPIDEATLRRLCRRVVAAAPDDVEPYGVRTLAAFEHFRGEGVDVAVLEAGVGGRTDATNLADADVAVVTGIGDDHADALGGSREAVARHIAGVVGPSTTLVTGATGTGREAVEARADEVGAAREPVRADARLDRPEGTLQYHAVLAGDDGDDLRVETPIVAGYQEENLQTALAALRATPLEVSRTDVASMLREFQFPGRGEYVDGDPALLLDGAHNREGVAALATTLGGVDRPVTVVFTALDDKPWRAMLTDLEAVADRVVVTDPPKAARADNATALATAADDHVTDGHEAVRRAVATTPADGLVVVTGSLYLIRAVRPHLVAED